MASDAFSDLDQLSTQFTKSHEAIFTFKIVHIANEIISQKIPEYDCISKFKYIKNKLNLAVSITVLNPSMNFVIFKNVAQNLAFGSKLCAIFVQRSCNSI